ncbi:dihydrodipicolinate synthase family protein [Lentibacter algarum]|uniref:dihydrodipicolinate synthase family protein n=1 Tax=Lentibacter algarum TaxID=576131 RepID=UPI001C096469|nr:dihydrodipicolinate synthase family protein [Lentibacter algarum]MBU2983678.1 dihydrodipicolinate synthase family protein [Lentibacter algarum]
MDPKGVYPILPTPFTDDGKVDLESMERLIKFQNEVGVNGVNIMGFMGESHKLANAERKDIINVTMDTKRDGLEVWVGIRTMGTMGAVEQAIEAEALGADAVFVAPVSIQNDNAIYAHYKAINDAVNIPVALHDLPDMFDAIVMSPELIARMAKDDVSNYIKLEEIPTGPKTSKTLALADGKMGVFGGLGAMYMLEEMERGAKGIMSGFSFPEVLVKIYNLFETGDREGAAECFDKYVSLLRYEFQPGPGLAFRKHVYKKRGIFTSDYIRPPTGPVDQYTIDEFERTIARAGLSFDVPLSI